MVTIYDVDPKPWPVPKAGVGKDHVPLKSFSCRDPFRTKQRLDVLFFHAIKTSSLSAQALDRRAGKQRNTTGGVESETVSRGMRAAQPGSETPQETKVNSPHDTTTDLAKRRQRTIEAVGPFLKNGFASTFGIFEPAGKVDKRFLSLGQFRRVLVALPDWKIQQKLFNMNRGLAA